MARQNTLWLDTPPINCQWTSEIRALQFLNIKEVYRKQSLSRRFQTQVCHSCLLLPCSVLSNLYSVSVLRCALCCAWSWCIYSMHERVYYLCMQYISSDCELYARCKLDKSLTPSCFQSWSEAIQLLDTRLGKTMKSQNARNIHSHNEREHYICNVMLNL